MTRPLLLLLFLTVPLACDAAGTLRLATTTSTDNSGLLQVLLPPFEARNDIQVHVIAVGTGKALRLGAAGDVDLVLVHARAAEDDFVVRGNGVNRRDVMYNDFVLVGPPNDPAGIRGQADVAVALKRIALAQAPFLSRGDDSGTHRRERALWRAAGLDAEGSWYREAGQGMGRVLLMSGEMGAYTLTDRGTWLALGDRLDLEVLVQGDPRLRNPYGVIAVDPAKYPDVNYLDAMALIAWMTSVPGQDLIREFHKNGTPLFHPGAIP